MEEKTQAYKYLLVWQRSMELVPQVYKATKRFPADELYGLTSQIRRAIVSVPTNIAEGQGRIHPREFVNFLSIARASLAETDTLLQIANRLGYIDDISLSKLEPQIIGIRQLLQKLIQKIRPLSPDARRPTQNAVLQ